MTSLRTTGAPGNSCGCRKHGLICNIACKNCAGTNCINIEKFSLEEFIAAELEEVAEEDSTEDTNDLHSLLLTITELSNTQTICKFNDCN